MGLLRWWKANRERSETVRRSLEINSDQEIIAAQVPELAGMSEVEGMAHVMQAIQDWNKSCTPEQAATFAGRLKASNEAWEQDGLIMPYWGNLWALRSYQNELGLDVPFVAPPVGSSD